MKTFQQYCEDRTDEGLGRFVRGIINSDYAELPDELKTIYDSLDNFQHQHVKQLMQYNHMTLAQALTSLPSVDPRIQWKAFGKGAGLGGKFAPTSYSDEAPAPGWQRYKRV